MGSGIGVIPKITGTRIASTGQVDPRTGERLQHRACVPPPSPRSRIPPSPLSLSVCLCIYACAQMCVHVSGHAPHFPRCLSRMSVRVGYPGPCKRAHLVVEHLSGVRRGVFPPRADGRHVVAGGGGHRHATVGRRGLEGFLLALPKSLDLQSCNQARLFNVQ